MSQNNNIKKSAAPEQTDNNTQNVGPMHTDMPHGFPHHPPPPHYGYGYPHLPPHGYNYYPPPMVHHPNMMPPPVADDVMSRLHDIEEKFQIFAKEKADIDAINGELEAKKAVFESEKTKLESEKTKLESEKTKLEAENTELKTKLEAEKTKLEAEKTELKTKLQEFEQKFSEASLREPKGKGKAKQSQTKEPKTDEVKPVETTESKPADTTESKPADTTESKPAETTESKPKTTEPKKNKSTKTESSQPIRGAKPKTFAQVVGGDAVGSAPPKNTPSPDEKEKLVKSIRDGCKSFATKLIQIVDGQIKIMEDEGKTSNYYRKIGPMISAEKDWDVWMYGARRKGKEFTDRNNRIYSDNKISRAFYVAQLYAAEKGYKLLDCSDPDEMRDPDHKYNLFVVLATKDKVMDQESKQLWHGWNKLSSKAKKIIAKQLNQGLDDEADAQDADAQDAEETKSEN